MAGTASSQVRSAYVAETVPGTTPASPAFTTLHQALRMAASPAPIEASSLIGGGARMGVGISGIPVTGELPQSELVYGVYDTLIETLLQGAWTANVLKDGKLAKTVTVENTLPAGVGGTATMLRFRGVEMLSGRIMLQSGAAAMISGSFGGMGSDPATTSALATSTYTNPTFFDPLSSGVDVGTITMAGYTLDCIQSLDMDLTFANRDPQAKISSDDLCGYTRGDFRPTLTATIYTEANFLAMYNAARLRTTAQFAVTVPIGSVTNKKYTVLFPKCRFGAHTIDMSGATVLQRVPILPLYDTVTGCVMQVTRNVA
jgi:hypothetical protein